MTYGEAGKSETSTTISTENNTEKEEQEPQSFAESALLLAGIAGRQLGWRPDDFWRATPAELIAMLGLKMGAQSGSKLGSNAGEIGSDMMARLMKEFPDG